MTGPTAVRSRAETPQARAALTYALRGWPVLPCKPRGKVPLTRDGFYSATAKLETVVAWWGAEPTANVALVPARAVLPDGRTLLVLDCDGPAGLAAAVALDVPCNTARVMTGRVDGGEHRYFSVPVGIRIGNLALAPGLDIRHAAGYVLVPPSVHPSGAVYKWHSVPAWMPDVVLPLPVSVLDRLTAGRPQMVRPCRNQRSECVASGPGSARPESSRQSDSATWWRLSRYLAKVPAGLADGRKTVGYRLAAALVHDFVLGAGDAWDVLAAWNADNVPPLPDRALAQLLRNATKYGQGSCKGSVRGTV
jgi:hypothetical protein